MPRAFHIAVAGAGIAGLTAALALSARGMTVTLFEQAEAFQELGAGLQISPNAWRVFQSLGLADRLVAASVAPPAIRIRSGRTGATLARLPLGHTAETRWGGPYRVIHRADLQKILADAVAAAGVELRLGVRITGLATEGGQATIRSAAGESVTFDGVVGADGVWSTIRREVLGDAPPRYSGKVAWRTNISAQALPAELDPAETGLWLGRDTHLVHYGVRNGAEINIIAVVADDWREPGWSAPGDPAEVARAFAEWPAPARALITAPSNWGRWALADRPPERRWGYGPVTLAGDAAHPMLPFLAQGAAMGIEDGWVLAASLAGSDEVASAFRGYEARRGARTARAQRAARANGDIYHLGGIAARARDLALSVMGPQRLLERWDWLYGWRPPGLAD